MGKPDPDAEESDLVVRRVSVAEFERMILDGTIVDNCTVAAWGLYRLWREQRGVSRRDNGHDATLNEISQLKRRA